jgi:hypothetical protein
MYAYEKSLALSRKSAFTSIIQDFANYDASDVIFISETSRKLALLQNVRVVLRKIPNANLRTKRVNDRKAQ